MCVQKLKFDNPMTGYDVAACALPDLIWKI